MNTNIVQIEKMNGSELFARFDRLESAFNAFIEKSAETKPEEKQTKLLTRKDVSKLLAVSLVTVDDWSKKGILTAYKAGKRVYFKSEEVESSLIKKGSI